MLSRHILVVDVHMEWQLTLSIQLFLFGRKLRVFLYLQALYYQSQENRRCVETINLQEVNQSTYYCQYIKVGS